MTNAHTTCTQLCDMMHSPGSWETTEASRRGSAAQQSYMNVKTCACGAAAYSVELLCGPEVRHRFTTLWCCTAARLPNKLGKLCCELDCFTDSGVIQTIVLRDLVVLELLEQGS